MNCEMENTNETLRRGELDDVQRPQHVATQLIDGRGIDALYEQILDTAVAILHSDFASLQIFYPERGIGGELRLLGHRGFSAEAAARWEWVGLTTMTVCGEALRIGRRVAVADVRDHTAVIERFSLTLRPVANGAVLAEERSFVSFAVCDRITCRFRIQTSCKCYR